MIGEKLKKELNAMKISVAHPCVSIIFSTNLKYPHFKEDLQKLKGLLRKAEDYLAVKYPEKISEPLVGKVREVAGGVDFFHVRSEGLGIFVSENHAEVVHFPFPVKERVVVTDNFETRDKVMAETFQLAYLVLCLNERSIRLFKGKGMTLEEVTDINFPTEFIDQYMEPKPSRGSSYGNSLKGTHDKSFIEEERFTSFLRLIDKKLGVYLNGSKLILSGGKKNIADFEKISDHSTRVIAKVAGNHDYDNIKKFQALVWKQVKNFLKQEDEKVLAQFKEAYGTGMAAWGIEKVWQAAQEGKGLTLLVEKDFSHPAFHGENKYKLLHGRPNAGQKIVMDAVDDVIEIVLKKGGSVVFLENGQMEDFNKIGLLLRYK